MTVFLRMGAMIFLLSCPLSGWAQTVVDVDYPPPQPKKYSWQANVFVASALLAATAGIVIICLDGGTSTAATERLKHQHCDRLLQRSNEVNNIEVK